MAKKAQQHRAVFLDNFRNVASVAAGDDTLSPDQPYLLCHAEPPRTRSCSTATVRSLRFEERRPWRPSPANPATVENE